MIFGLKCGRNNGKGYKLQHNEQGSCTGADTNDACIAYQDSSALERLGACVGTPWAHASLFSQFSRFWSLQRHWMLCSVFQVGVQRTALRDSGDTVHLKSLDHLFPMGQPIAFCTGEIETNERKPKQKPVIYRMTLLSVSFNMPFLKRNMYAADTNENNSTSPLWTGLNQLRSTTMLNPVSHAFLETWN